MPEMQFFSAHDFQVANLLMSLQPSFNETVINYASTVKFELYRKGPTFYVKTIYNGREFIFEECANLANCEVSNWLNHMSKHFYMDWDQI